MTMLLHFLLIYHLHRTNFILGINNRTNKESDEHVVSERANEQRDLNVNKRKADGWVKVNGFIDGWKSE